MFTLNLATIIGGSLVGLAVLLIAFSQYRHWLVFMCAGMVFWGGLELLRAGIQSVVDMPLLYGYVSAMMVCLFAFTVAIALNDRRLARQDIKVKYIEHTPVYDD